MNLSDIKAQFLGLMNRRDLTTNTALTQTFIDQAVMRIQRDLRCPAMEKSVSLTIQSGYGGLLIPIDYLELISIIPSQSNERLDKVDITDALKLSENTGCPRVFSRRGALYILGPAPSVGDVIQMDYYAELAPLVNPTDTNVISVIAWDLIVYAALVQACAYYKDNRKDEFETEYERILTGLQDQSDDDELNGTAQVMPAYSFDCE